MFNRNDYKLSLIEKRQQTFLRFLLFISTIIVLKGIYNTNKNIDQDNLLWPSILLSSGFFCLIYGLNAITTGNLVKRWMNENILGHFINVIEKLGKVKNEEDAISKATKLIGLVMLLGCTFLFFYAVIYIKNLFYN